MLHSAITHSGNLLSGNVGRVHLASGTLLIQSGDVASGSVQGFFGSTRHIASGTVGVFDFGSGAVIAGTVGSGAIQSGNIASGQLGGNHYGSGSIQSGHYASGSISHFKLADIAIQSGQVGSGALGGSLGNREIASGTVGFHDVGSGQILSGLIASGQIGQGHYASGSILSGFQLTSGSILGQLGGGPFHVASGTIDGLNIGSGSIRSGNYASGSISQFKLASGIIGSGNYIGSGTIGGQLGGTPFHVSSGTIGSLNLGSGIITNLYLGSGSVQSGAYASGGISQFKLASGLITSGVYLGSGTVFGRLTGGPFLIASGSIDGFELGSGAIRSGNVASGQIGPTHLASGIFPQIGYIFGLGLTWVNSGRILVNSGIATDKSGFGLMTMPTSQAITISGTNNGLNATDISPIGNVHVLTSGLLVSGPNLFNHWPIRTGTGLLAISGTKGIVGSGGDLLNQVAVGDLVGNSGASFWRVTAINSGDITIAISGGITSGTVLQIIENAFFCNSGQKSNRVSNILSGVSMQLSTVPKVSGSAVPGFIGSPPDQVGSGGRGILMVWLGTGTSGTNVWASTQRTTPLVSGIFGLVSGWRRIGSVFYDGFSGSVVPFSFNGPDNFRRLFFEAAPTAQSRRILSAGQSTSFAPLDCSFCVPPSAFGVWLLAQVYRPAAEQVLSVGARNVGESADLSRGVQFSATSSGTNVKLPAYCPCDPSQSIQYVTINTDPSCFLDVIGYEEKV